MALIERLRGITATEDDDYFTSSTLVYYINQAQIQLVSMVGQREKYTDQSFRALDNLRATQTATLSSGFTSQNNYFVGTQSTPSDLLDWVYAKYNTTPLKELQTSKQYLLEHGNAIPTDKEGYINLQNAEWKLFIHEDPDGSTDELIVEYLKEPTEIVNTDNDFAEIPDQLTNAVLYKAAVMLGAQEGRSDLQSYQSIYQQELKTNLY